MDNSLSKQASDWREGRRLRAWELQREGWKQQEIADAFGVSKGAVSQWMKRGREEGVEGLRRRIAPGATPRLSEEERARLPELLAQGAPAHGFRGDVWTCERVAKVIRKEFGVSYHPAHVCRVVAQEVEVEFAKARASSESAGRRSDRTLERGALAFSEKGAIEEGRTILFVDQSGFYLLPTVVRTYAPIGQTPILREQLSRDHLSVMSGITLEGKLLMIEQERAFKGEEVVCFLKHALRQIAGKLLVIWDGSPIHRAKVIKEFLVGGAAARLQLEQLPGYAPELNPDEGIWKHLKYVELKNVCCRSLSELRVELRKAKERLRHKKHVILGCIRQPGFEV
jgi:transposase